MSAKRQHSVPPSRRRSLTAADRGQTGGSGQAVGACLGITERRRGKGQTYQKKPPKMPVQSQFSRFPRSQPPAERPETTIPKQGQQKKKKKISSANQDARQGETRRLLSCINGRRSSPRTEKGDHGVRVYVYTCVCVCEGMKSSAVFFPPVMSPRKKKKIREWRGADQKVAVAPGLM